jgi:hypothetical protein
MTLLAVTLGLMQVLRPTPAPIVRIVHVPVEVQATPPLVANSASPGPSITNPAEPTKAEDHYWPGPTAYVRIREQVFRCGLDALPNPSPRATPLQTTEQPVTVENLLGLPPRSPAIPNLFKLATFFNAGDPL